MNKIYPISPTRAAAVYTEAAMITVVLMERVIVIMVTGWLLASAQARVAEKRAHDHC